MKTRLKAGHTRWFSDLFEVSTTFCFTKSRIKFLNEEFRQGKQPLQGQVLCYYGNNFERFKEQFSDIGNVLRK